MSRRGRNVLSRLSSAARSTARMFVPPQQQPPSRHLPLPSASGINVDSTTSGDGSITNDYIVQLYASMRNSFPTFPRLLRSLQVESLVLLLSNKNLLLLAPTGYGKTLIYTIFGIVKQKVGNRMFFHQSNR